MNAAESNVEMANLLQTNDLQSADQTSNPNPTPLSAINSQLSDINVAIIDPNRQQTNQTNTTSTTASNNPQVPHATEENDEEDEIVLKYGAGHVVKLFVPVTICLIFVILSLSFVTSYQDGGGATLLYTPFNEQTESNGTKLWMSIANASIFISVVIVMTVVLILLYKFKCYRIIHGWLAFSSLMLLFFFTYMYISEIFKQFNWVTDMITVSFLLWNFGILGMFCIHWKGPLLLQQGFLIFSCIQMALVFIKYLPEWTTWVLLALISVWDLVAVLCPFGPLRILVETAHERNDNLFPAMVYSSTLMYSLITMADTNEDTKKTDEATVTTNVAAPAIEIGTVDMYEDGGFRDREAHIPASAREENRNQRSSTSGVSIRNRQANNNEQNRTDNMTSQQRLETKEKEEQENGVKLGLGDFIFYSILVGKASILGDWNTVIACVVAILIGLCLTLTLLAIFHKPLPALPISLLFGLIFYFLTNTVVRPFYETLAFKQIFI